jgi:hypothetical protein
VLLGGRGGIGLAACIRGSWFLLSPGKPPSNFTNDVRLPTILQHEKEISIVAGVFVVGVAAETRSDVVIRVDLVPQRDFLAHQAIAKDHQPRQTARGKITPNIIGISPPAIPSRRTRPANRRFRCL